MQKKKLGIKKSKFIQQNKFWAGVLLAQFLCFYAASYSSLLVRYIGEIYEIQKKIHQLLFAWFPFSVGDLFYLALIFFLIVQVVLLFKKENRSKPTKRLLICINMLYFSYQIFWGMMYFQPPLVLKLPPEKISISEVKHLTQKYLEQCKNLRSQTMEDKNGVFKMGDFAATTQLIIKNQKALPSDFLSIKTPTEISSVKKSIFGSILSATGISGYYNPFTAEAQYDPNLPDSNLLFTLAHETAHQMGYAREQEASFIGFLTAQQAENTALLYSADYFALKSLIRALAEYDAEYAKGVIAQFSPAMQRDRQAEIAFHEQHQGFLSSLFSFTNDLFLKSNRQDGSITYSYFVELLVRYERMENYK